MGIGVIFCWCQLARGLQINVCVCMRAHAYVRGANKGALTNTRKQISSSAEKQRVKRECRFHRQGEGAGALRLVLGCVYVCVRGERGQRGGGAS